MVQQKMPVHCSRQCRVTRETCKNSWCQFDVNFSTQADEEDNTLTSYVAAESGYKDAVYSAIKDTGAAVAGSQKLLSGNHHGFLFLFFIVTDFWLTFSR